MLRALLEAGVVPDVVVGTSVGAINGAAVAADPSPGAVEALRGVWLGLAGSGLYAGGPLKRMGHIARARTHVHPNEPLRALLTEHLGDGLIEDLAVPFQCVAASIERAAEHWFTSGPVVDAVLASSAVPGLLPPVRGRRRALPRRRAGQLHPGRPGGHAGRRGPSTCCRSGGSTGRSVAPTSRGRSRRWPSRSPGGTGSPATWPPCPPDVEVHVLPTGADEPPRTATCRRCATATSARCSGGSTRPTGRPRPTSRLPPSGPADAAARAGPAAGAGARRCWCSRPWR